MDKTLFAIRWNVILNILSAALILTYPALWNRFPIILSDSGTYITTALNFITPWDRPIFYSYFIGWTDIYRSLWFVIFAQNILLAIMIWKVMRKFSPQFSVPGFFLTITALTSFTTMAWFSCQIMTDVFTSLLLLSLSLLLFDKTIRTSEMIFVIVIFFFSCLVHYSHFLLAAGLVVSITLIKLIRRDLFQVRIRRLIMVSLITGLVFIFIPIHNFVKDGTFYFSKGSGMLFTSKLLENGLLKKYLDAHCGNDMSPLCAYKDQLPVWGPPFLYGPQSAANLMGLAQAETECRRLNLRIAESYPLPLLLLSIKGGAINLFRLNAGTGIYRYDENTSPWNPIKEEDRTEFNQWNNSRQQGKNLDFTLLSIIQRISIFSTLIILLLSLNRKDLFAAWNPILISFARFVLLALILNALITGALASEYDDRYQTRIAWLVPLVVMIMYQGKLFDLIRQKWKTSDN